MHDVVDYLGHPSHLTRARSEHQGFIDDLPSNVRRDSREIARKIGQLLAQLPADVAHYNAACTAALESLPNDDGTDAARGILSICEPFGCRVSNSVTELATLVLVALDLAGITDRAALTSAAGKSPS